MLDRSALCASLFSLPIKKVKLSALQSLNFTSHYMGAENTYLSAGAGLPEEPV
jgi:hypothetical protein